MKSSRNLFSGIFLIGIFCTGFICGSAEPAVPAAKETIAIRGELEIFPLTSEYIAVAGIYDNFFNREIKKFTTKQTGLKELLFKNSANTLYNYGTARNFCRFLPQIGSRFQDPDYFRISVNGLPVAVSRCGYWINAVGCKRVPDNGGYGVELTDSAELVPFAYLRMEKPLTEGDEVTVLTAAGETARLVYSAERTLSRAIKVNQVGYAPEAGRKYAYLGMWLGGESGAMPVSRYIGKPFFLRKVENGGIAFQGSIAPRSNNQCTVMDGRQIPLDGEEVLELDFSSFSLPGQYYIQIPGVGRSWEFVIDSDAVGRAYYVQMRGLFHQRSGIAKTEAHTRWTTGSDHMKSYRGGFVPNDRHYRGNSSRFKDKNGKQVDVNHFDMVKATATDEGLPDVYGGWWDAGDFDRRSYHFEVVDALLSVYLLFPENFSDSQLDIPESGNGVPDIVDEAAWGVDIWRRAQNPDGGVGCWLEATSHPENPDPALDIQRYYLALPTRESTIKYAAHAAKLARAYKKCGAASQAALFFQSAVKAWEFALNPANSAKTSCMIPGIGKVYYEEPESLPETDLFKAAVNLHLYSGELKYAEAAAKIDFGKMQAAENTENAYFFSELAEDGNAFPAQARQYKESVLANADKLLLSQQELSYRNIGRPLNSKGFLHMAWGNALPFRRGSHLILAWRLEKDRKYRDAALLCFDWMMGANPMGRAMTTGLGKVYPVRLLSLPMWAQRDYLADPTPGITPYTFTGQNSKAAARMIYCYIHSAVPEHNFRGCSINLLPRSINPNPALTAGECYSIIQRVIPVWRRFANLEGYAVNQNEFSVWETMAPAAAAYGALLTPGWKPPEEWKRQRPEPDIRKIPGYIFLP